MRDHEYPLTEEEEVDIRRANALVTELNARDMEVIMGQEREKKARKARRQENKENRKGVKGKKER